ncbi:hypothetical protein EI94DRAFT_1799722 [Lactarius quietus]|nr:hypothetical protein EI94DRAFT_1799722 [Lactarius quietus]
MSKRDTIEAMHILTLSTGASEIKPDSVLIDKNGHLTLSDFGLSPGVYAPTDGTYYAIDQAIAQSVACFPEQRRGHPKTPHDGASRDDCDMEVELTATEHTGANEVIMKMNNLSVPSFEIFGMTHVGRRVKVAHGRAQRAIRLADVALLTEPR